MPDATRTENQGQSRRRSARASARTTASRPGGENDAPTACGPLAGLRVVEFAGIGPGPFAAMMLGDLGADVIRIDRPGGHSGNPVPPELDVMNRNRRSIDLDLKDRADLAVAQDLSATADVVLEGYRPGVAERLGIGPKQCLSRNPRLVYGRMTGWGQDGPLAARAGHDINYIARAGVLAPIGTVGGPPVIPLNVIGDFGGGGMLLALGVLAALFHASRTGVGQVVDASIVDGAAALTTMLYAWRAQGLWQDERGTNLLDGGAHFYNVYETADHQYLSVGAIEPQFYEQFIVGLGQRLEGGWLTAHTDRALWPTMCSRVAGIVGSRDLVHWLEVYDGTDACVAPVLTAAQAVRDEHNVARATFIEVDGITQPAPAPRFSVTAAAKPRRQPHPGQHREQIRAGSATGQAWLSA